MSLHQGSVGWSAVYDCGILVILAYFNFSCDLAQFNFKKVPSERALAEKCTIAMRLSGSIKLRVCAHCPYNFIDVEDR